MEKKYGTRGHDGPEWPHLLPERGRCEAERKLRSPPEQRPAHPEGVTWGQAAVSERYPVDRKMTSQPSTREENVLSVQRAAVMQGGGKEGQPGYPGALVLAPQTELAP